MDGKYNQLVDYLSKRAYPEEFNKSQKSVLRKYSQKFKIIDGELFYDSTRRVVKNKEEAVLIFREFHQSANGDHTGMVKTRKAISSCFYWPGMTVDIDKWVLECDFCKRTRAPINRDTTLKRIQVSSVWEVLGLNFIGPVPETSSGHQYIMTVTDYFSKWVEGFAMKTKTAVEAAEKIVDIICTHGCPKRILSDQGREFVNQINLSICKHLETEKSVIVACHPQRNSLYENHNNIVSALRKLREDQKKNWDRYLNATLFSLRSKIHTSTKQTPFMLMYGREAVFPSEVPVDYPFISTIVEDQKVYEDFLKEKLDKIEHARNEAAVNIEKTRATARMKKVKKRCQDVVNEEADQLLPCNMGKKARQEDSLVLQPTELQVNAEGAV